VQSVSPLLALGQHGGASSLWGGCPREAHAALIREHRATPIDYQRGRPSRRVSCRAGLLDVVSMASGRRPIAALFAAAQAWRSALAPMATRGGRAGVSERMLTMLMWISARLYLWRWLPWRQAGALLLYQRDAISNILHGL